MFDNMSVMDDVQQLGITDKKSLTNNSGDKHESLPTCRIINSQLYSPADIEGCNSVLSIRKDAASVKKADKSEIRGKVGKTTFLCPSDIKDISRILSVSSHKDGENESVESRECSSSYNTLNLKYKTSKTKYQEGNNQCTEEVEMDNTLLADQNPDDQDDDEQKLLSKTFIVPSKINQGKLSLELFLDQECSNQEYQDRNPLLEHTHSLPQNEQGDETSADISSSSGTYQKIIRKLTKTSVSSELEGNIYPSQIEVPDQSMDNSRSPVQATEEVEFDDTPVNQNSDDHEDRILTETFTVQSQVTRRKSFLELSPRQQPPNLDQQRDRTPLFEEPHLLSLSEQDDSSFADVSSSSWTFCKISEKLYPSILKREIHSMERIDFSQSPVAVYGSASNHKTDEGTNVISRICKEIEYLNGNIFKVCIKITSEMEEVKISCPEDGEFNWDLYDIELEKLQNFTKDVTSHLEELKEASKICYNFPTKFEIKINCLSRELDGMEQSSSRLLNLFKDLSDSWFDFKLLQELDFKGIENISRWLENSVQSLEAMLVELSRLIKEVEDLESLDRTKRWEDCIFGQVKLWAVRNMNAILLTTIFLVLVTLCFLFVIQ